jgi:hypothetical protein
MHGLPADFDGSFLTDCTLEQICVNENQISLHFDRDVVITLESEYLCVAPVSESDDDISQVVPAFQPTLIQLIGQSVVEVAGAKDGTLSMTFRSGHRLTLFDTPQYESYQIRRGQHVIIV